MTSAPVSVFPETSREYTNVTLKITTLLYSVSVAPSFYCKICSKVLVGTAGSGSSAVILSLARFIQSAIGMKYNQKRREGWRVDIRA